MLAATLRFVDCWWEKEIERRTVTRFEDSPGEQSQFDWAYFVTWFARRLYGTQPVRTRLIYHSRAKPAVHPPSTVSTIPVT